MIYYHFKILMQKKEKKYKPCFATIELIKIIA